MEWYWILLIVLASVAVFIFLFSVLISILLVNKLSKPEMREAEYCLNLDLENKMIKDLASLKRIKMNIEMSDGYLIHGDYIPSKESKGLMIFTHGYTWCREGSLKFAELALPVGYDCYIYDLRGHGENKRVPTTMGYKESHDLHEIIEHFRKEKGPDFVIGLWGESLGAATTLQVLQYGDKIAFAIEDSGYSSLRDELHFYFREMPYMCVFLPLSSLFFKMIAGSYIHEVNAVKASSSYRGPLLAMHSDADGFVPFTSLDKITKAHDGELEKHIFHGPKHCEAIFSLHDEYVEVFTSYISRFVK